MVGNKSGAQPLLPRLPGSWGQAGQANMAALRWLAISASLLIAMVFAVMTNPSPVLAALGGDATSVEADRAKMEATLRTTSKQLYTVHEMHTANVVVREYVSPAGKVFGVAWQGVSRPDLSQLLGPYFEPFTQAVQSQKGKRVGRGPLAIQQPGFVVEMGGHMRAYVGRAYLPQMVPAGVNVEELR